MSTINSWEDLVNSANKLVEQGVLSESQIKKIIDIISIRTLVTNNKLTPKFIQSVISPLMENDLSDANDDNLKMTEIYKLQEQLKKGDVKKS